MREDLLAASDPLACDCRGHTALMIAADLGNAPLVDLLLPVSDAAAISNEGLDAAFLARVAGMAPTCNLILAHDAGVEAAAMRSSTPPADERADASKPKRPRV